MNCSKGFGSVWVSTKLKEDFWVFYRISTSSVLLFFTRCNARAYFDPKCMFSPFRSHRTAFLVLFPLLLALGHQNLPFHPFSYKPFNWQPPPVTTRYRYSRKLLNIWIVFDQFHRLIFDLTIIIMKHLSPDSDWQSLLF